MKKRVVQLITGLATAGMLAATGVVGTQLKNGVETTKTVEYKMEENEFNWLDYLFSDASSGGEFSAATGYTKIEDLASKFTSEFGVNWNVKSINSVGFQGNAYALYPLGTEQKYLCICSQTNKNGPIRICGFLIIKNKLCKFRYSDGIIWTFDDVRDTVEINKYCVSTDGTRIVQRDSARGTETAKFQEFVRKYNRATIIY